MSKYFSISGFWKDDKTEFNDLIVKEYDDSGEGDEDVFFFGLSEAAIIDAINVGEETVLSFVITSYKEIKFNAQKQ